MSWINYWFVFVIFSAFSHAMWNFLLKQSEEKSIFFWFIRLCSVTIFFPLNIYLGTYHNIYFKDVVLWGGGSILLHSLYSILLTKAYEKNSFLLVYPIARGTAPLLTVLIGIFFLKEEFKIGIVLGALLIFVGIYLLHSRWKIKEFSRTIRYTITTAQPLLVGFIISGYTVFDKMAISHLHPVLLILIESAGQVFLLGFRIRKKAKKVILQQWKANWYKMLLAGGFSGLAYVIVLFVLTGVPVSQVAPLRETSIVIGSLLSVYFLKEKLNIKMAIGSGVIFLGVLLIIM